MSFRVRLRHGVHWFFRGSSIGIAEYLLLLIIVVALALIFRQQIIDAMTETILIAVVSS